MRSRGRIQAVKKSASEFAESWVKGTEFRQKQHSEFVTPTENDAAEMESLKLAQRCGNQSAEREQAGKSKSEGLLVIHEMIEMLNDDDALEPFKATLSSPSSMQDDRGTAAVDRGAVDELRRSPRTPSNSASNLKLISLALSGKSADSLKVTSMIDDDRAQGGTEWKRRDEGVLH